MRTHTDKNRESKRQSVAAALATTHKGNPSSVSFVDNRPEVLQKKELQGFMENRKQPSVSPQLPIQKKANTTGLPDQLKNGIEQLSGYSMDDVKVHRNSPKPAQLHAHAYAQGTNIHLGPGQEKHLPHEAWHVVQQKQGRVKPTILLKEKVGVNDDPQLEHEADVMGRKALQRKSAGSKDSMPLSEGIPSVEIAQLVKDGNFRNIRGQMGYVTLATDRKNMGHTYIILETKDGAWMYHFRADARNMLSSLVKMVTWYGSFEQIRRNPATSKGKTPQQFVKGRGMNFHEIKVKKSKVEAVKALCENAIGGGTFSLILSNIGIGNNCFSKVYNILKTAGFAFTWSSYLYSFVSPRLALSEGEGFYEKGKEHKKSTYSYQ